MHTLTDKHGKPISISSDEAFSLAGLQVGIATVTAQLIERAKAYNTAIEKMDNLRMTIIRRMEDAFREHEGTADGAMLEAQIAALYDLEYKKADVPAMKDLPERLNTFGMDAAFKAFGPTPKRPFLRSGKNEGGLYR